MSLMRQAIVIHAFIVMAAADAFISWAEVNSKGFVQQNEKEHRQHQRAAKDFIWIRKESPVGVVARRIETVVPQADEIISESREGIKESRQEFIELDQDYKEMIQGLQEAEQALEENKKAVEHFEQGKRDALDAVSELKQERAALKKGAAGYVDMGDATPVKGSALEKSVEEAHKDCEAMYADLKEVEAEREATTEEERLAIAEARAAQSKIAHAHAEKKRIKAKLDHSFKKVGSRSHTKVVELLVLTNEALKAIGEDVDEDMKCDLRQRIDEPAEVSSADLLSVGSNKDTALSSTKGAIELASMVQSDQRASDVNHHHRQAGKARGNRRGNRRIDVAEDKTEAKMSMEKTHEDRIKRGVTTCNKLLKDFDVLEEDLNAVQKAAHGDDAEGMKSSLKELSSECLEVKCEQEVLLAEVGVAVQQMDDEYTYKVVREADQQLESEKAVRGSEQIGLLDEPGQPSSEVRVDIP